MPIQPRPRAETLSPERPSWRNCMMPPKGLLTISPTNLDESAHAGDAEKLRHPTKNQDGPGKVESLICAGAIDYRDRSNWWNILMRIRWKRTSERALTSRQHRPWRPCAQALKSGSCRTCVGV